MDRTEVRILPMKQSGGEEMLKAQQWYEIHSRYRAKESKKSIARSMGVDVRTVRKILQEREPVGYRRSTERRSIVKPFEAHIHQRLAAVGYCARSVFEELKEMGYAGGYDTIKRYIQPHRKEARTQATLRFETPPGVQGQVDWGQCWTGLERKKAHVHLFVMTLGYSRRIFPRATTDEKLPTFLHCHQEAFEHFGGYCHCRC